MAMLFEVQYPAGGRTWATGYPDRILVVQQIPPGPDGCYLDEIEVDFTPLRANPSAVLPVLRIVGGPRRPTMRVRVPGNDGDRERWMEARDAEGWYTLDGHDTDPEIVWVVADRDGMDPADLPRTGCTTEAS